MRAQGLPPGFVAEVRAFDRFFSQRLGIYHQHMLATEYSLPEARVIGEIGRAAEPWVANQLAQYLEMDRSYLTRTLNKLEKKGLVQRVPSLSDARKKLLHLTALGEEAYAVLERQSDAMIARQFAALSDGAQREVLAAIRCLRRIWEAAPQER